MKLFISILALGAAASLRAQVTLGDFEFDQHLFGDTLSESDGGSFSSSNWLNVVSQNPGNPGFLTGANFNTGIANIGMTTSPIYTIGYNSPIVNRPGNDLGIVVARYTEDNIRFSVSEDGSSFSPTLTYGPEAAADTGVHFDYFYGGGGPFNAELFVQSVDLSDFGIAIGSGITAVRVTGDPQLDLVRVAGFVPEPGTYLVFSSGAILILRRRRAMRSNARCDSLPKGHIPAS